ncbi:exocyst complex component EXO70B1 [Morus notabilis]|uniref:exocyst complex component EXO70B1 n=1 Tax=Morus notabilis TaxID=981085 RepID=UPI000CED74A5|nr:exocyst complex component EXO70B1 [Morus notabilis]
MENKDLSEEDFINGKLIGNTKTEVAAEEELPIKEETPPLPPQADGNEAPDQTTIKKASEEIVRFVNDDASIEAVPADSVINEFLDLVEEKITKRESNKKYNHCETAFLESVNRVSKLHKQLNVVNSKSEENSISLINRIGSVQQRAMAYLQEEFRSLLEDSKTVEDSDNINSDAGDNIKNNNSDDQSTTIFPGYTRDVVLSMNKIAKEMIFGGYESECCEVYMIARRNALEEILQSLGFEKITIDDVQKMHWESLEREIVPAWINTFRQCATVHFAEERSLAEAVFSDHNPSIAASLFSNLARGVVIQLLDFSEGIAMSKRSAEKLFKTLDMYETLRDMVPKMDGLFPADECAAELSTETSLARSRLGEAAICIFCDLENSIKADTGRTPVPGGAVHPLTRYTINYLKYACEYKDTIEQVFKEHSKTDDRKDDEVSPFSVQLIRVMDLLDSNLETKSKVYKDVALSSIFMMNNGRYILQKIKTSAEINGLMGDTWCRRKSSELRQFHKNYQRETWSKLLGCLSHEGLNVVNGKVAKKPVLKERFKSFNAMFEEIHRTQSSWVVSDEQLQSELRVSITAVVIPAYRAFLGRFSQYLDPGRQTEKYVKFQPEDLENYIDELFDGNTTPMARRKQ